MTGSEKFGKRSPGAAQYFLVTPWSGDPADMHDAFKDKSYVKSIASRVRPEARFKSGSQKKMISGVTQKTGFYSIYSAVGLGIKKMNEELEEFEGEVLTEAILDRIKSIWNKFKTYIARMWKSAKAWIGNSWQRLVQFLGLEPMMFFNNTPAW